MKIALFSARFALSGVPLAQIRFARSLAALGHDVELIFGLVNPGYRLPDIEGVKVLVLNKSRVVGMIFPIYSYFKSSRPDVVFSAGDHLNAIVLLAALMSRSAAKISCSSRVTPFDTYSNVPFTKRWILKHFMWAVMWRANSLTCVSEDMVAQYKRVFNSCSHTCIYNIVCDKNAQVKMDEYVDEEWINSKSAPIIVAAGMLEPWKGFVDLVYSMEILLKTRNAKLLILGDGSLRNDLQCLIESLNLSHAIKLIGYVDNPLKYFKKSDIFVLSSYVEGMPNVLVEAMMCGCTPVATDCPTGPSELLGEGKYGYLVPVGDSSAMATAISQALDRPIAINILQEAIKPFEEEAVITKHFAALGIADLRA